MEWLTTEDGKYRIVSLSAATFHGALSVIKEFFCQEESVCIGTEVNKNEKAAEELLELCADTALDGVSLVAVHIETGEIVAVSFNKLQVTGHSNGEYCEMMLVVGASEGNLTAARELYREHFIVRVPRETRPLPSLACYRRMMHRLDTNGPFTTPTVESCPIRRDPQFEEDVLEHFLCVANILAFYILNGFLFRKMVWQDGEDIKLPKRWHYISPSAVSESTEKPFFEVFAEQRCSQPSSRALVEFMADLDGRVNLFERLGLDCSLEIMFLATHSNHRYRKLGTLLCKVSVDLAKKLKDGPISTITVSDLGEKYSFLQDRKPENKIPKFCQAIWTSSGTQKIGEALGFRVYLRIPFTEYSHNSKTFSERIGYDVYCEAVAKIL